MPIRVLEPYTPIADEMDGFKGSIVAVDIDHAIIAVVTCGLSADYDYIAVKIARIHAVALYLCKPKYSWSELYTCASSSSKSNTSSIASIGIPAGTRPSTGIRNALRLPVAFP